MKKPITKFPKHLHHLAKLKSGESVESLIGNVYKIRHVTFEGLFLLDDMGRYLTINQLWNFLKVN